MTNKYKIKINSKLIILSNEFKIKCHKRDNQRIHYSDTTNPILYF